MNYLVIKRRQDTVKIKLSSIYYIRTHPTRPHYLQIVTETGNYDLLENLSDLERQYSPVFIKCHRNCLVNISKIKEIQSKNKLILLGEQGDYQVSVSRRRCQTVLGAWLKEGEEDEHFDIRR